MLTSVLFLFYSLGVQNFPRKGRKKASRDEKTVVCVLSRKCADGDEEYLITQRPEKGQTFCAFSCEHCPRTARPKL